MIIFQIIWNCVLYNTGMQLKTNASIFFVLLKLNQAFVSADAQFVRPKIMIRI